MARKTVRVRIAVITTLDGKWNAEGWKIRDTVPDEDLAREAAANLERSFDMPTQLTFIVADVPLPKPLPEPETIEAKVVT